MAIKPLVESGVNTVFKILAELVETVTIESPTATYNTTTGVVGASLTTQTPALFVQFKRYDGSVVKVGDRQILIKRSTSLNDIRPDMKITRANLEQWRILSIELDPTNTVYIIHGRQGD